MIGGSPRPQRAPPALLSPLACRFFVITEDPTGAEVNQVCSLAGDTGHRFIDVIGSGILAFCPRVDLKASVWTMEGKKDIVHFRANLAEILDLEQNRRHEQVKPAQRGPLVYSLAF